MTDGFIQVPVDSTGKKVDTTEITRPSGVVVERERIEVRDDSDNILSTDLLYEQLKITNRLLQSMTLAIDDIHFMLKTIIK